MFYKIVFEFGYHRFAASFGMTHFLRVIPCSHDGFSVKKAAQCCHEFEYELRAAVHKEEREDAVPFDSLVKIEIRTMWRCRAQR